MYVYVFIFIINIKINTWGRVNVGRDLKWKLSYSCLTCLMAWGSKGFWSGWYFVGSLATQWVRTYRKDLEFNNWIFCYLDFSEVGGCHNFLVVLSWVFGKSEGWIFSDWAETLQRCCWLVHLGFVRWD